MTTAIQTPDDPEEGQTRREEFGAHQLQVHGETAASAVEAHARAAVQSRYIMAMQNPRSWDTVRAELLRECKRPGFAKAARYYLPVGKGIEGATIRFAEACLAAMRNTYTETTAVFDDNSRRILQVSVFDLERNTSYSKGVTIRKEVERKKLKKGQEALGQRLNSYGERVYLVRATDDEVVGKENALVSKALRTQALRLVPGWLQEEAMELVMKTLSDRATEDPDVERHKLADAFADLNVMPVELEAYLGCRLSACTPAQLVELRGLWTALQSGEATWAEIMDAKGGDSPEAPEGAKKGSRTEKLRERLEGEAPKKASKPVDLGPIPMDPDAPVDTDMGMTVDSFQAKVEAAMSAAELSDIMAEVNNARSKGRLHSSEQARLTQDVDDRSRVLAKGKRKR